MEFDTDFTLDNKSGFEDIPKTERCNDPQHDPPNYLHIPKGKRYRHVCPRCGKKTIMQPPQISL